MVVEGNRHIFHKASTGNEVFFYKYTLKLCALQV
jgi:hypothetical protein